MKFEIPEITEVKVVTVDVDSTFAYLDLMNNGKWRLVYTKNLEGRLNIKERTDGNETV